MHVFFIDIDEGWFELTLIGNIAEFNYQDDHADDEDSKEESHIAIVCVGEMGSKESQIVLEDIVDRGED